MNNQLIHKVIGCLAALALAAILGCPKDESAQKNDADAKGAAEAIVEQPAAGELGEVGKAMSDADLQAKLDAVTAAIKAGELDKAESVLKQLEELKDFSDAMTSKIESSRAALDAAKAAEGIEGTGLGNP